MPQEEIDAAARRARPRRAGASCASRAATRSCSAAAARRRCVLRAAGIAVRGRPGRHRRRRRARLRRDPRHAARPGQRASRSSPATRTRPSRSRRSTGRRSPRFPGTLVFYMGVRALPRIAERLIAGGRAADEPAAVIERGTLPGQRTVLRHARRHRGARGGGGHPRAGDDAGRAGRRPARAARLARGAAAVRPHRRGHPRPRAGERARRAAARPRRGGGRGAGDPHRAARRRRCDRGPRRPTTSCA